MAKRKQPPVIHPAPKVINQRVSADQWVQKKTWVKVKSSNVEGIAYDMETKTLFVEFGSGLYQYNGVMPEVAKAMFMSKSMGKFVASHLKGNYSYNRIT